MVLNSIFINILHKDEINHNYPILNYLKDDEYILENILLNKNAIVSLYITKNSENVAKNNGIVVLDGLIFDNVIFT